MEGIMDTMSVYEWEANAAIWQTMQISKFKKVTTTLANEF